jgi:hypothetical protein
VHFGAPAEHEAAQRAWKRSLTRKDQVACVQKILRLLDRYGVGSKPQQGSPCKLDPLERVRPGDGREEIERARELYWLIVCEQSATRPKTVEPAAQQSSRPAVSPNLSRRGMSEDDDWKAAIERIGVPVYGNGVLHVRCGLGRKGLVWGYPHYSWDSVPADKWRSLREEALATNHVEFDVRDLDGLTVGEAFLALVIKDPKVQACGAWLNFRTPDLAGFHD